MDAATPDTSTPRDSLLSIGFDIARNAIERGDSPTLYTATTSDAQQGSINVTTNQGRTSLLLLALVGVVLLVVVLRR